jgi:hypothetical protein
MYIWSSSLNTLYLLFTHPDALSIEAVSTTFNKFAVAIVFVSVSIGLLNAFYSIKLIPYFLTWICCSVSISGFATSFLISGQDVLVKEYANFFEL